MTINTNNTTTERLFQRITNPKTGEQIESQLTLEEATEICSKAASNFARDLASKSPRLSLAQTYWLFKLAEETHSLPQITLLSNVQEYCKNIDTLYFIDLTIKRYGDSCLKIFANHAYAGKIVGDTFEYKKGLDKKILEQLLVFSDNPMDYIVAVGRKTGRCCVCGRELTNPESIAAGIGPICAERF